ncbi:CehA/McbA family metallohydrolase [Roseisolibacter agri]|uniref:Polymerase/histidinol phosphatase N-terminal domain-containing protein n=1 Tax=Roseisolibacter agri TaxID=2014610 RepID=A0AA37QK49_9BACT|nr:CehA/McbA family metallohydrolase [Roseisolibacter agri]GLC28383.1 hypothetical protein rosag_48960 [Roseisolibacter agri]
MRPILRLVLGASFVVAPVHAAGAQRWYRGNTHVHTRESDGNRPPEEVARWYRDHGYHFLVVTDHERITDPAPLNAQLGKPGAFLVIAGQEITQQVADASHPQGIRQAHVVSIAPARVVLPLGEKGIAQGTTVAAMYASHLAAVRAAGGLAQVNHPNFRWSVRLEDMAALPDSTPFELWNAQPRINNLGGDDGHGRTSLSTEALWDSLLTRGRLLWAVGSDDAHNFAALDDAETTRPGGAWIMVRADTLTPAAIVGAMRAGRFYATTGVLLADVAADARAVEVTVAAPTNPRDDRRYRTRFVGRGGRTLAVVAGTRARYAIRGDEGYVRAVVVDSDGRTAWTQPLRVR